MSFFIRYPETRTVSTREIEIWYSDAVANEEIVDDAKTVEEKARALHNEGHITLARQ